MSKVFFEELLIPDPNYNLNVGAGSHSYQIAETIQKLAKVLPELKPHVVLVPGDTNSALAAALSAIKGGVHVAHFESGARCYDMSMAEEINRRIVDHISFMLFAVSENCVENLKKESVLGKIFLTGDTMYDVFLREHAGIQNSKIIDKTNVKDEYCVLTLHRAENVDNVRKFKDILTTVNKVMNQKVIFPIHPRTKSVLNKSMLNFGNIITIDPLPYHDMMRLIQGSSFVLTDSGGLQKEALWCKTPCITLRERTEWVETINLGVNFIAGTTDKNISVAIQKLLENYSEIKKRFNKIENPYGDGNASKKITNFLLEAGRL